MYDTQKIAVVAVAQVIGPTLPATTPTFGQVAGFTGVARTGAGVYVLTLDQNVAGITLGNTQTTLLLKATSNGDTIVGSGLPMACSAAWTTATTITVRTAVAATGAAADGHFTLTVERVTEPQGTYP